MKYAILSITLAVIVLTGGFFLRPLLVKTDSGFGSARQQVNAVNLYGTQADPELLTGNWSTSTLYYVKGFDKITLAGVYKPGWDNNYMGIWLECSIDDGVTYFPYSVKVAGTTEVDVYADSGTNASASSGIPFIIPGDKTSKAGRYVSSTFVEWENAACTHYRITAVDYGTAGTSTLYLQGGGKVGQ